MNMKLTIGLSRKVDQPNIGSRQASIGLEVELDPALVTDSERLQEQVRRLYRLADQAVETELARSIDRLGAAEPATADSELPRVQAGTSSAQADSVFGALRLVSLSTASIRTYENCEDSTHRPDRLQLTAKQRRVIYAICRRLGLNPLELICARFQMESLDDLDIRQASQLMKELSEATESIAVA